MNACLQTFSQDSAFISVELPRLSTQSYVETPAMDMGSFISQLGGLLGVIVGFSAICVVEFALLFGRLLVILVTRR